MDLKIRSFKQLQLILKIHNVFIWEQVEPEYINQLMGDNPGRKVILNSIRRISTHWQSITSNPILFMRVFLEKASIEVQIGVTPGTPETKVSFVSIAGRRCGRWRRAHAATIARSACGPNMLTTFLATAWRFAGAR